MDIVSRAAQFAMKAHGDQKRKYTDEPYWVHLESVARIVATASHDSDMLAAAWLHDVLEDTPVSPEELLAEFEESVYDLVIGLTDSKSGGNRKTRKALDRERLASAGWRVQTIKLADLIDNTSSIVEHDPKFARVYLDEKEQLVRVLTRGDPVLLARAWETLQEGQRKLIHDALGERGGK